MAFTFPDEIQTESVSRYTKLGKGTTTLRMIGDPIFYNETWVEFEGSRTPKRFALDEEIPMEECGPDGVVMSIKAYNYGTKSIQIWSISQKTILKKIKSYSENSKYGDPTLYDLNVEKTGEGKQTRYEVVADPKEPMSDEVKKASDAVEVELDLLLLNENPFIKSE